MTVIVSNSYINATLNTYILKPRFLPYGLYISFLKGYKTSNQFLLSHVRTLLDKVQATSVSLLQTISNNLLKFEFLVRASRSV